MIIITGSAGQVGTELVKIFLKKNINHIRLNKIELDITKKNLVNKVFKNISNISVIINLAAYTNVEKAEIEKKNNDNINYVGVKNLCNYIKNKNILLISISTDYVFDGKKNLPYLESDKTNPLNNYGLSKRNAEKYISDNIVKYVILRTSWVFSKKKSSFFNFIDTSIKNNKVNLINDIFGNPTSASSLGEAILKIITYHKQKKKFDYGIYHFCNHPVTNWIDFGKYYFKIKNYDLKKIHSIKSNELKLIANRPKNSSLSSKKFEKTFNFKRIYWKKEISNFF